MEQNPSSPMMSSAAYRCAVAVNNKAVALLSRQCFEQAHATFREALSVLQNQDPSGITTPGDGADHSKDLFFQVLHRAEKRVSNPESSSVFIPVRVLSYDNGTYGLRTIQHTLLKLSEPSEQQENGILSSGTVYSPVTIEILDTEAVDDIDHQVISAVTLHNLALSFLCKEKAMRELRPVTRKNAQDRTVETSREKASRVFILAHSLLSTYEPIGPPPTPTAPNFHHRFAFLSMIILANLYKVLCESGKLADAHHVMTQLHSWSSLVGQLPETIIFTLLANGGCGTDTPSKNAPAA